jgi:hypothetical protein
VKMTLVLVLALLTASGAGALEIPFRDGSVIQAESYRLTGSYILVTRADGRQVAYNAADVDIEALKATEAEAAPDQQDSESGEATKEGLGRSGQFSKAVAAEDRQRSEVAITDHDVDHVGDTAGDFDEGPAEPDTIPDEFIPGGTMILVENFKVEPLDGEEGRYRVTGEVSHRGRNQALNVGGLLESNSGVTPWAKRFKIADYVNAGETVAFTHDFSLELREGVDAPQVKIQTFYQVRVADDQDAAAPPRRPAARRTIPPV